MNALLRALIADDEPLARARLQRLLREDGRIEVVASCRDGVEAMQALQALQPQVAFLDIQMPHADGFDVVAAMPALRHTRIVFVTAHAGHALHAFDVAACDYLLKPLSPQRLQATLDRLCAPVGEMVEVAASLPTRLTVPAGARLRVIEVASIEALIADGNYVELHCGQTHYRVRDTLARLERRLDPRQFLRIHRSRIVRLDAVRDVELLPSGELLLRLHGGLRVSSGRSHRAGLRQALGMAP